MTDKSFELIMHLITPEVVHKIMEMNNWSEDYALERFTESKLYSILEKEETKTWHYSALMLAQLFNDERSGNLSFPDV